MTARPDNPHELGAADETPLPQHAMLMIDGRVSHAARGFWAANMGAVGEIATPVVRMFMPNGLCIHYSLTPGDARRIGELLISLADKADIRAAEQAAVMLVNLKKKGAE